MKTSNKMALVMILTSNVLLTAPNVMAGGFFGDIIEIGCGGCGAGRVADQIHDQVKRNNPTYGRAEEQFTNDIRADIGLAPHCTEVYDKWEDFVGCL